MREQLVADVTPEGGGWLTTEEFAARIRRHPNTVCRLAREGKIVGAERVNGKEYRIPASSVNAFYEDQPPARPLYAALGRSGCPRAVPFPVTNRRRRARSTR